MGHNRSHQIKLIPTKTSDRHVVHLALGFHLPEYLFLITPAMMKSQHLLHGRLFVRHNHRKLITVLMGNEQIQLDRPLKDPFARLTDQQKPISAAPTLGLPMRLKNRTRSRQNTSNASVAQSSPSTRQNAQTEPKG